MLYKKYHRNYIKQFKVGTRFRCRFYKYVDLKKEIECEVVGEPFIKLSYTGIGILSIDIPVTKVDISDLPVHMSLIFLSGRLCIKNVEFIENDV